MLYLNYGASVLALLVLAAEVWFVLKRNRQIKVKGKDDFFSFALVLLFCMAIFPPTQMETLLESFRNVVILMAVFGSLAAVSYTHLDVYKRQDCGRGDSG